MTFTIKTIGCKVNTYESNKIKAELINAGLIFIDVNEKSEYKNLDYYIINTCSVTSVADKKSRQMIHQAKQHNKNLKVIATGCYVDAHVDDIDKEIDKYFVNNDKMKLVDYIISDFNKRNIDIKKEELDKKNEYRVREFIKIQDGCNQYCTYCIIPFLRGNIRSRDDEDVVAEVKEKVKNGTKEIVLTGIHLSSFGLDRVGKTYESEGAIKIARSSLLNIIKKIAEIKIENNDKSGFLEVERIRLGSLEPRIIDDEFILELKKGNLGIKFCYSFCLSLQSGCGEILKRMNRHYTPSDYENACSTIRKHLPEATITTDIIVGFPGETEDNFNESLSFVKKMRFYNPNIFPYSRRPGTKADTFDNQLTREEKHRRAVLMIKECEKITKEIEENYDFNTHEILIEETEVIDGIKYGIGYTKEYIKAKIIL